MRGFILAAGFGTRLRPLTEHIPKALVPVAGTPLLSHTLNFLSDAGIKEICVNSHYLPDMIELYQQRSKIPFTLFNESGSIRGTGGAFHFARDFLREEDEFFVANVDILARYSFQDALDFFHTSDALCMLLAFPAAGKGTIYYEESSFSYCGTSDNLISSEKVKAADFIGAAMYKKAFLDYVTADDFSIVPTWGRAVADGKKVIVYIVQNGYWKDIGTLKALLDIHCDIIDNTIALSIPKQCTIDRKRKICIPRSLINTKKVGRYSWIESDKLPSTITTSRSVIFSDAHFENAAEIKNAIVTSRGVQSVNK